MPRKCTVCIHEKVEEINQALLNGVSYRDIAGQYGLSDSAIDRHKQKGHIAKELVKGDEKEKQGKAVTLYGSFESIRAKVDETIASAEDDRNWSVVLQGLRELRELFKLKVQMEALRMENGVEVDPIALTLEIRGFLSDNYPKAHKGLLKHLQERYEYYRTGISQGK